MSGFRIRIQGGDSGLFRVGNQGQHLGSGFRVRIQGQDLGSKIQSLNSGLGSGSGFRVRILFQDLGSGFRVRI